MKHETREALVILAWTAVMGFALAALLAFACAASAQVLVSMDRADYVQGPQHVECWLAPTADAFLYFAGAMSIECVSDLDGVFRNGFEVAT